MLESIKGWKDVDELLGKKNELYQSVYRATVYNEANRSYVLAKDNIDKQVLIDKSIEILRTAAEKFDTISDWSDAAQKAANCRRMISENEIKRLEQKRRITLSGIAECKGVFAAKKRKELEEDLRQIDEELKKLGVK